MQSEIRNKIKKLRAQLSQEIVKNKSKKIADNLFAIPFLFEKQNYFIYKSFKNEVDTDKIIKRLTDLNKTIAYPITINDYMVAGVPKDNEFILDKFGVSTPKNYTILNEVEVAFIPLVACDKNKNRIGFGKGYYDKFLKDKNCIKVGICYDFQVVDFIEPNPTDIPLDIIVTESGIIW